MILMGDEARRSQHGNNNAYCQDNETSWFDWTLVTKHAELHRFVKLLIARRLLRDVEHERERVSLNQLIRRAGKGWHGVKLGQPDWGDHSHSIALTAEIRRMGLTFHLIANSYWESARLRTAKAARQLRRPLAAMDRHLFGNAARHRRVAGRPVDLGRFLSVRAAFRGRAFREYCAGKLIDQKERSADRGSIEMEKLDSAPKVPLSAMGRVAAAGPDRLQSHGFVLR